MNSRPVALITGGSRGIGLGCALALARAGYDLAVAGRRPEADCRTALDSLRDAGADVRLLLPGLPPIPDDYEYEGRAQSASYAETARWQENVVQLQIAPGPADSGAF